MFERARDFTARGLLPALLLALALLMVPLDVYRSEGTCHGWHAMQLMGNVGELKPEMDELIHALVEAGLVSDRLLIRHHNYLWLVTIVFALAYLMVVRDGRAVRIAAFATVLLTPIIIFLAGTVC